MMNIDLTGRSAIVTRASRGIGLAVTRALAGSGAHVIAGAQHSSAELDKLATAGTVTVLKVDLVLLLASDVTGNVTGTDIRIDGGLIPTW
ncbi:MAG: hypothetical protein ACRDNO_25410 [Trebonia sp.]